MPELKVDICNACHPFYTGKLKYVDTAGRIEKFKSKFAGAGYASLKRGKKAAKAPPKRRRRGLAQPDRMFLRLRRRSARCRDGCALELFAPSSRSPSHRPPGFDCCKGRR